MQFRLTVKRRPGSPWRDLPLEYRNGHTAQDAARALLFLKPKWYGVAVRRMQSDGSPGMLVWADVR